MLPVAGTVLSPLQVDLAIDAGAAMAVAPGFQRETVLHAQQGGTSVCARCAYPDRN